MATTNGATRTKPVSTYEAAALGLPNYWYPIATSRDIKEKPTAVKFQGELVALMRRNGKVYAVEDACAHRGTQLSIGKYEFPGTNTITCRYHGWTYDVTDGICVANLTEGPESAIVGKIRIRTYPIEERKGIVWIWAGKSEPVPLEEDVPALLLRDDTMVRVRQGVKYGNWRWHAENVGGGHAQMLHRDTIGLLFNQFNAHPVDPFPYQGEQDDDDAKWILQGSKGSVNYEEYPGLGKWPRPRPWRRSARRPLAMFGLNYFGAALRLPGITRVMHFPLDGWFYYEWYTAIDEDHYLYFQVSTYTSTNLLKKLWQGFNYMVYGKPFKVTLFNNQDVRMVKQTTDYTKRKGIDYLTPLSKQDGLHIEWRRQVNAFARGVEQPKEQAAAPEPVRDEPAIAGGSE
jgi:phenylpropionate dioxygenase-like ring-hydroxylating dioxygenase large terminal subunit